MLKFVSILIIGFLSFGNLYSAKVTEFSTTFDTSPERDAWSQIRENGNSLYHWGASLVEGTNSNYSISHDYNVGGQPDDITRDLHCSPKIYFHNGAKLEFKYSLFSMMGTAMSSDKFQVYILSGNDVFETNGVLLKDLTDSINGGTFVTTELVIPYTGNIGDLDSCHLGFLYQSSLNWYVPSFDDVNVYYESSVVENTVDNRIEIHIKYSDCGSILEILTKENISETNISIYDVNGHNLISNNFSSNISISLSALQKGIYLYKMVSKDNQYIKTGKIIL